DLGNVAGSQSAQELRRVFVHEAGGGRKKRDTADAFVEGGGIGGEQAGGSFAGDMNRGKGVSARRILGEIFRGGDDVPDAAGVDRPAEEGVGALDVVGAVLAGPARGPNAARLAEDDGFVLRIE